MAAEVLAVITKNAATTVIEQFGPAGFAWSEAAKAAWLKILRGIAKGTSKYPRLLTNPAPANATITR